MLGLCHDEIICTNAMCEFQKTKAFLKMSVSKVEITSIMYSLSVET